MHPQVDPDRSYFPAQPLSKTPTMNIEKQNMDEEVVGNYTITASPTPINVNDWEPVVQKFLQIVPRLSRNSYSTLIKHFRKSIVSDDQGNLSWRELTKEHFDKYCDFTKSRSLSKGTKLVYTTKVAKFRQFLLEAYPNEVSPGLSGQTPPPIRIEQNDVSQGDIDLNNFDEAFAGYVAETLTLVEVMEYHGKERIEAAVRQYALDKGLSWRMALDCFLAGTAKKVRRQYYHLLLQFQDQSGTKGGCHLLKCAHFDDFITHCQGKRYSKSTKSAYASRIRKFRRYLVDKFPEMMKHLETEEMIKQREQSEKRKKRKRKSVEAESNVSYATKSRRTVSQDQAGQSSSPQTSIVMAHPINYASLQKDYDHQVSVNNLLRKKLEIMRQNLADRKEYARRVHSNQQKLHELEMQGLHARIRHLEEVNMRNSYAMQVAQSNFQYPFQDVRL